MKATSWYCRRLATICAGVLGLAALQAPGASADFGIAAADAGLSYANGNAFTQAGAHPERAFTVVDLNTHPDPIGGYPAPDANAKDVLVDLPPGLLGNPTAVGQCTLARLAVNGNPGLGTKSDWCPTNAQIGNVELTLGERGFTLPLYSMEVSGIPTRWAFNVLGVMIPLDARLRSDGDYGFAIDTLNINSAVGFSHAKVTIWGTPGDPSHDQDRCWSYTSEVTASPYCRGEFSEGAADPQNFGFPPVPYVTMPTTCPPFGTGLRFDMVADSWIEPGVFTEPLSVFTHDPPGYPSPPEEWGPQQGTSGCEVVPFNPTIEATPTLQSAESPSGLDVTVEVPTDGLLNSVGVAQSHVKKTVVALPEGVTINPSQGEGLGVCTLADLGRETVSSAPGVGCPSSSKIGTVDVETPVLEETLSGSVYVAQPDNPATSAPGAENPFDSLIALYMVIRNQDRGILIKLPGKVEPDVKTGQIVTTFDDLPPVPFSRFTLHFREGQRSPLATPRACGRYTTTAQFTPYANPDTTVIGSSSFEITSGVGGGRCSNGIPPFEPQLRAGTLNNNALSYSPFTLRMTRNDGEQEITRFSADLPPGLAAKLAGIPRCSEADLARTAAGSGFDAISRPICPLASQVGRVTAGYGVGTVLTYATGRVFLAGPYRGTPLSIATVVPAVVGPFDLGTVVQRSAFSIDPESAEVHVDSKASDPIPHILKGLELHLRDVRVYMDRPEFTFNPTSCDRTQVGAFLDGSGVDFFSPADDPRADVSNPFQAANCSLLGFKPELSFELKGGTKRGDFPALRATLKTRAGDANIDGATVILPRTEFIEQGHIRTVCTRVQFNASGCPAGSIYGHARAITPLLDSPLEGPVYLRSNGGERVLPDLVATLRGEISVNAVGFVDSFKGRVRTTFHNVPDTPVSKFVLAMQGGQKGLLVNHLNLCKASGRASVRFTGQNGKVKNLRPEMKTSCGKRAKKQSGKGKTQKRLGG